MNFDLDDFLKNYKPKDLEVSLINYLKCDKLDGYDVLKYNNRHLLVKGNTYVKYVPIEKSSNDKNYESHIKLGGILLSGGKIINRYYKAYENESQWKYLLLKYTNDKGEVVLYNLSLVKNYIFFKTMKKDKKSKDDAFRKNMFNLIDLI